MKRNLDLRRRPDGRAHPIVDGLVHLAGEFGSGDDLLIQDADSLEKPQREKGGPMECISAVPDRGTLQSDLVAAILQDAILKGAVNEMRVIKTNRLANHIHATDDFQGRSPQEVRTGRTF